MPRFDFTRLGPDEVMIFGPLTVSKARSLRPEAGQGIDGTAAHTRKLGISTQRVVIENGNQPEATQIVQNSDVAVIWLRQEIFAGYRRLIIDQIQTRAGEQIVVDLTLMDPEAERKLEVLFPQARIKQKRGCLSYFPFLE